MKLSWVRGNLTPKQRFYAQVRKTKGCWEWQGHTLSNGRGRIHVDGKRLLAHRYSYVLHVGPIPKGLCICHHCDNPKCVRPSHLFVGTLKENQQDCLRKGRFNKEARGKKGVLHHKVILSESQVMEIRAWRPYKGETMDQLASRMGMSNSGIQKVIYGQNWKHLH